MPVACKRRAPFRSERKKKRIDAFDGAACASADALSGRVGVNRMRLLELAVCFRLVRGRGGEPKSDWHCICPMIGGAFATPPGL